MEPQGRRSRERPPSEEAEGRSILGGRTFWKWDPNFDLDPITGSPFLWAKMGHFRGPVLVSVCPSVRLSDPFIRNKFTSAVIESQKTADCD